MADITVVGGGLAGLVASIASAEKGARVRLHEAHQTLGGRARASAPPFIAHEGPHGLYDDGPLWRWLDERDLVGPAAHVPLRALAGSRFRWGERLHSFPPAGMLRMLARRRRRAPVDQGFHTWAAEQFGEQAATAAANYLGVVTFDHDPGRLSAALAWQRLLRTTAVPPRARYVIGGWTSMLARLEARARTFGVRIELDSRVDRLPEPPVIVATSLDLARRLLGDDSLHWNSGRTLLLDLGLRRRRGDAFVISDLDEAGRWTRSPSDTFGGRRPCTWALGIELVAYNVYKGYGGRVQTDTARRRLRELILDGTYPAGARLTELEVAAALGMSRTPVREAIRTLAADGLVHPTGWGVTVVALDPSDLDHAYQLRAAVEGLTAELATDRQRTGRIAPAELASLGAAAADAAQATAAGRLQQAVEYNRRFHRRVAELAGNPIALSTLDRLWDQIQVSTLHSLAAPARPARVAAQHDQLLAAIADGRAADAGRIARQHALDTHASAHQEG